MAFPATPLDTRVELLLGGTHIRSGAVGATAAVASGGRVYTPDAAVLDITSDIDVRVDVAAVDWTPPVVMLLASKSRDYGIATSNLGWYLTLQTGGTLQLTWSPTGAFGAALSATSTAAVGATDGTRKAVRVTLDVNNGSGGRDIKFYTADTISGTWVQLGSTVTAAGATSIAAVAADVEVGTTDDGSPGTGSVGNFLGKIYAFELYNGIAGTRVIGANFTALRAGDTTYLDNDDNTWTFDGSSVVAQDWVDATADALSRGRVEITTGRANEAASAEPSTCAFELGNRSGNYSPRKPTGQYYGRLGGNTHSRVSVPAAVTRLLLPRAMDDYVFTHDSAGLSVTGDIDVRVDVDLPSWQGLSTILAAKHLASSTSNSWVFLLEYTGYLWFGWSANGTAELFAQATVPVPLPHYGRKAVRATLDVDNGAAGKTVTFYTASTMGGSWTQLGDPVTTAGTTSIFDGTVEVRVGGYTDGYAGGAHAQVYEAQIRNGIAGSLVGNPVFTSATAGAVTVVDAQGNVWYLTGTAEVSDRDYRFHGEVASWGQATDRSGTDVSTHVTAGGVRRRLGQGNNVLESALRRAFTNLDDNVSLAGAPLAGLLLAYWPCEDGDGTSLIASALPGYPPMSAIQSVSAPGGPDYASFDEFACSSALLQLKKTWLSGLVPDYTSTGEVQLWFLLAVPSGGVAAETVLARVAENGGSVTAFWQLYVTTAGSLRLVAFDLGLSSVVDTGAVAFGVNGKLLRVSVELVQDGTDIDYAVRTLEVGAAAATSTTGTLAGATLGKASSIDANIQFTLDDVAFGHVSVHSTVLSMADFSSELNAWSGETAAERIRRLCAEEGVDYVTVGSKTATALVGPQRPDTLLNLVDEAALTDGGILHDARGFSGFAYRTRESMCAQDALAGAALTLDYAAGHLSALGYVDDDQLLTNDVTASRAGGGASAREVLDDGSTFSVGQRGRYDTSVQVNPSTDGQLRHHAGWWLNLGTSGEARCPAVVVALERAPFVASASLSAAVRALALGDLLVVGNPPSRLSPDDVRQLVQGAREALSNFSHTISVAGVPAGPWDTGVYSGTGSRYSPFFSRVGAAVTPGGASLVVVTPVGAVWGTADLPYDVVVGGERMTVTAVSGSASPQTFTVTRSVNGVVKAHLEGVEVRLFRQVRYSF